MINVLFVIHEIWKQGQFGTVRNYEILNICVNAGGAYHTQFSTMSTFQYMLLNNLLVYACNLLVYILAYGLWTKCMDM